MTFRSVLDVVYRVEQEASSAVFRRRYRREFADVQAFCLFVGYPRSGHSIVGACLNAHRHAVISHELGAQQLVIQGCSREVLYSRILARAHWFNLRGNRTNYTYEIPNQRQGRFDGLHVIGDKLGGAVTRCIARHPDFLDRLRSLVDVPLRLIHVVRNPFDNIAAISIWHHLSLEEAAQFYFRHVETTARLDGLCSPGDVVTIRHEEMIRTPDRVLADVCAFVGLELYPRYIEDCASVVFKAPTYTRRRVDWSGALIREVEQRIGRSVMFQGYGFTPS